MRRVLIYLLAGFSGLAILGALVFWVTGGPLADLRPDVITTAAQPERESRGRALLQSAWEAAGGERTMAAPRATFTFRDHWADGLPQMFNPWPDARSAGRDLASDPLVQLHRGAHERRSGRRHLGHRGRRAWTERDGQRAPTEDPNVLFMLPTVHYFVELSQRLTEAPIVRWVEERTLDGRTYDVVFATWQTVEAHDEHDQYLVFIDRQTGRIGKVQYTVREVARFAVGTCHLDDQREIDGVWIPHRMTVTSDPADDTEAYMHRMTLSDFRWEDR